MKARVPIVLLLLAVALMSGSVAHAQRLENKRPIVFIWAEDIETLRRQPLGSGFVLGPQGDVLTAKHVVRNVVDGQRLVVSISTKSEISVRVDMSDLDCSPTQDFCLVRVPADVVLNHGMPGFYRLGCYVPGDEEPLMAAGFFGGGDPHAGVVTPRGMVIGGMITGRLLPTSIPLEAGMSGGPVFDRTMTVIGLVKGGTTGGQFGFVQLLQPARSMLADRGMTCLDAPPARVETAEPRLSGAWQDQFGALFRLDEVDGRVTLSGRIDNRTMAGTGERDNATLAVRITNTVEPGTIRCTGTIVSDIRVLSICVGPDMDSFPWELTRVPD